MADYTLGIFGNANMDDTIDEQDIEYVQGIIDGTNDETELADANYDGQIDEEDIAQIEQIIAGEETELTIIDSVDRIVTVKVPVENLMSLLCENEVIRILGAQNKVVAVNKWEAELHTEDHPVMCNTPVIGSFSPGGVDYEKILEIAGQTEGQDIVITYGESYAENIEERLDSSNDIKVVKFTFNRPDKLVPQLKQLAVMLGESEIDRCQEYVNWRESIFEQIEDEVQEIPSEERVTVYYEESGEGHFDTSGRPNSSENVMIYIAGGKSISEDLSIDNPTVDPEWVLVNDPE
jgi:iron complex transport system substrate-binding protein